MRFILYPGKCFCMMCVFNFILCLYLKSVYQNYVFIFLLQYYWFHMDRLLFSSRYSQESNSSLVKKKVSNSSVMFNDFMLISLLSNHKFPFNNLYLNIFLPSSIIDTILLIMFNVNILFDVSLDTLEKMSLFLFSQTTCVFTFMQTL